MKSPQHVAEKLGTPSEPGQYQVCCPAHDDSTASLSVQITSDKINIDCKANCDFGDILIAAGLKPSDLYLVDSPTINGQHSNLQHDKQTKTVNNRKVLDWSKPVAEYSYRNSKREFVYQAVRLRAKGDPSDDKNFRQRKKDSTGRWINQLGDVERVPYRLPEILEADSDLLLIPEGEKDVENLRNMGFVATCNVGGAGKWQPQFGKMLPERHIVIFEDNDPAGKSHTKSIARSFSGHAKSIRIVRFEEMPPKSDVSDWLALGKSIEDLRQLIDSAVDFEISDFDSRVQNCESAVAGSIEVGTIVRPADRDNFGKVIADLGQECLVEFVSADGETAQKPFPKTKLRRHDGTPLDEVAKPLQVDPFVLFPIDSLPEPLMKFVSEGAEAIGCDPTYLALPLLSALGSAVGNSRRLFVKNSWTVPAIIWTAIIGESGTSKTPAFKLVMKSVRKRQSEMVKAYVKKKEEFDRQKEEFDSELADWKKTKKKNPELPRPNEPFEPVHERVETTDATIEGLVPILKQNPNGLLVERDELAGWFGSFDRYASKGQADSSYWLSMFNAEPIIVDRKTTGFVHVESAYVCVSGGIQPGIMSRSLTDENKESGIAARILMAYPPRKARRWTEADISESTEHEIDLLFSSLYELEPSINDQGDRTPVVVGMSDSAKKLWVKFYNEHNKEQVETEGEIAAAYSKLEEYPLRFALLFHLIKQATGESSASTLEAATVEAGIAIANWFKSEAKRVYAILSESEDSTYARQLFEWIERKGGRVTAREVQQGRKEIKTADEARLALDMLVELGLGEWKESENGNVGQPTRYFTTNAKTKDAVYGIQKNTVKNGAKNNTVDCRPVESLKNGLSNSDPNDSDLDGSILV